jgi:hypothetical protein
MKPHGATGVKESTGKHSAKHRNKASEVEADSVTIQFGPLVMKNLVQLEEAVRGKKDFDSDAFFLLQCLSSGKPLSLDNALVDLLIVARETAKYEGKTRDIVPSMALSNVMQEIGEFRNHAKGITLTVELRGKGR